MSSDFIDAASEILEGQNQPYAILLAGNETSFNLYHYNYDPELEPEDKLQNAKALINGLEALIDDIKKQNDIKEWK